MNVAKLVLDFQAYCWGVLHSAVQQADKHMMDAHA
jgi:hypothetical protein